jgi:hypothetical protein
MPLLQAGLREARARAPIGLAAICTFAAWQIWCVLLLSSHLVCCTKDISPVQSRIGKHAGVDSSCLEGKPGGSNP